MADNACSTSLRPDMVEAARQFMSTPKVRGTPFEEQQKFLLDKGLTEEEIQEARNSLSAAAVSYPEQGTGAGHYPQQMYYQQPPQTFGGKLFGFTQSVVVIGGASYMAYRFMRSWVLPKYFNVPEPEDEKLVNLQNQVNELQNSTKFIMDSVEQTLSTVSAQQEQLNRALMLMSTNNSKENDITRIQSDISIVKSLLLNQNQFPPICANNNTSDSGSSTPNGVIKPVKTVRWQANPSIAPPSWQLANHDGAMDANNHSNGVSSENHHPQEETDRIQSDDELYHEAQQQVNSNGHA